MTYAFTFDSSACPAGCKICQQACKDKNQLPVGVMWRRVIEVSGSESWTNNIFAYNLSLACNHCVHPKCAGVCPADAYIVRADGIVCIDSAKCMGCGYCSWACPYSAPQYNPEKGQMTKCDFCFDNIDAGLPPACVAACPMKAVLGFAEIDDGRRTIDDSQWLELWKIPASQHPFPLPNNSRTEPHLALKPHVAMNNLLKQKISNRAEIKPKKQKSEISLIVFTLLVQMAVGGFLSVQWLFTPLWNLVEYDARLLRFFPYLMIGICLALGVLFSFAHLGAKRNAWMALNHLRKSWLSREILFVGLFGAGWLVSAAPLSWQVLTIARLITSLFGIALIYSMAQVYRLRVMVTWNTWRTPISFFITALLLGQLLTLNVLIVESQITGINLFLFHGEIIIVALAAELWLTLSAKEKIHEMANRLRLGLIAAAMAGTGIMSVAPNLFGARIGLPIFLIVVIEEIIGRWLFYKALNEKIL